MKFWDNKKPGRSWLNPFSKLQWKPPTCRATLMLSLLSATLLSATPSFTQNSMRKIRVTPNATASKIGTAINWETDYATARKKSRDSGRPILWYVPRLADTFMDRKREVDWYMRAGAWSYPEVIASANQNYIPLMAVPGKAQANNFDLKAFKFIEPGFVVIEPDETVSLRIDRVTTINPRWITGLLKPASDLPAKAPAVKKAQDFLFAFAYDQVLEVKSDAIEVQCCQAMALFRLGRHSESLEKFKQIGDAFPNHPLGWKAAAEAQRIGPFVRGFETFADIPKKALRAGVDSKGSAAPEGTYTEGQLWQRGVKFLLSMQNERGGFIDSDYDFGGTDGLPNVHVAVTAICGMALVEAREREELREWVPEIDKCLAKAIKFVADDANLNPRDTDEIFWARLYRLRLFNRLASTDPDMLEQIDQSVAGLESIQSKEGNWYHEYRNPFVTASALWALHESKQLGAKVNASNVQAGVAALKACRYRDGGYTYGSKLTTMDINKRAAGENGKSSSAGRMPLCEGALMIWDQAAQDDLNRSLKSAFERHDAMAKALKYDDHTSSFNYGGFFFWYCMRSRTEAITQLEDDQARKAFAKQQHAIIMGLPEIDGCFVDSHEIGRSYGTAMALLCFADCEKAQRRNAP